MKYCNYILYVNPAHEDTTQRVQGVCFGQSSDFNGKWGMAFTKTVGQLFTQFKWLTDRVVEPNQTWEIAWIPATLMIFLFCEEMMPLITATFRNLRNQLVHHRRTR